MVMLWVSGELKDNFGMEFEIIECRVSRNVNKNDTIIIGYNNGVKSWQQIRIKERL